MGMGLIKKHNFDVAKRNIEQFSDRLPSSKAFRKVEEDGWFFGLNDHSVTGRELNNLTDNVQDRFLAVNDTLKSVVREFREVYNALEYLDKEYIAGIVQAVEDAESASHQALKAHADIRVVVDNLSRTVSKLVELKRNVDILDRELTDVNTRVDDINGSMREVMNRVKNVDRELADINTRIDGINDSACEIMNRMKKVDRLQQEQAFFRKAVEQINSTLSDVMKRMAKVENVLGVRSNVKLAYGVAGAAITISIVNIVLCVLGVI